MLSPLLFKIFFAVVRNVVLWRFSEDTAIVAWLVRLKNPSMSMGLEPTLDFVLRAVWGMLYADDDCTVSRSPQGMEVIIEVCRAFALTESGKKTTMSETNETLLYECSTWTLRLEHYVKLRTIHHRISLRIIAAQRKRPDHRMTPYNRALEITRCENIETALRTRILLFGGGAHPNKRRAAAKANRVRKT